MELSQHGMMGKTKTEVEGDMLSKKDIKEARLHKTEY